MKHTSVKEYNRMIKEAKALDLKIQLSSSPEQIRAMGERIRTLDAKIKDAKENLPRGTKFKKPIRAI